MRAVEHTEGAKVSIVAMDDAAEVPANAEAGDIAVHEPDQSTPCLDLLAAGSGSRRLVEEQKQLHLRAFFESLRKKGYSRLGLKLVGDIADVRPTPIDLLPPEGGSGALSGYSLPEPESSPLSIDHRRHVSSVMQAPVDLLVRELNIDWTIARATWHDSPFDTPTTVLGKLIRSRGSDLFRSLDALQEDVTFGLHELAISIEEGVSHGDFVKLLERADVDPGTVWTDRRVARDNTLALVAAFNAEPDTLKLLLQQGSDPSLGRRSVLDELPLARQRDDVRTDSLQEVVRTLVQAGDRPYLPSTLSVMEHWHGLKGVSLHPDAEVELAATDVEGPAGELMLLVAEWNRKIKEAVRLDENCPVSEIGEAVSTHRIRTLAAKTLQQEQLDQRRDTRGVENVQARQHSIEQFDSDVSRLVDDVLASLAQGRWYEAIAMVDEFGMPEFHRSLLSTALSYGADADVIEMLIERSGGTLPPDAVLMLASSRSRDAITVANELAKRGSLNLHFVDEFGVNAVTHVTRQFWRTGFNSFVLDQNTGRWLRFLASNSVTMKPSGIGLDPLDTVLLEMLRRPFTNRPGVGVARFLIDHGAPIESSHREFVEQIAQTDFDGYRRLAEAVPELLAGETY